LLVERRKPLHERAGVALESMFAEQLEDHLGELPSSSNDCHPLHLQGKGT
jgi:hypothetical protein